MYYFITTKVIENKESQLQTNPFFIKYKADLLSFFHKAIITNTKAIQSQFFDKLSHSDSLQLLNVLLQRQENEYINTIQDFSLFIKHINEFNLPICQVLLNVLFNNLVVDNDVGLKYNWKHLSILYYKKSSLNFLMKTPSWRIVQFYAVESKELYFRHPRNKVFVRNKFGQQSN